MSNPAALAAVPGLIRATRLAVETNAPRGGRGGFERATVIFSLLCAEVAAELLVELLPETRDALRRPQQQIHAPIGESIEPLVPRWTGHDARLPPGRPHP